MFKLILALAAVSILSFFIWHSNPRTQTEAIADHPYLNSCYVLKRARVLERSNVEPSGVDCNLLPLGCVAWFAKGGGVILETRSVEAGAVFRLAQVVRFSPGATAASDYYFFKPVKDEKLDSFYYTELPGCVAKQTTRAEFICLKDDPSLKEVQCD